MLKTEQIAAPDPTAPAVYHHAGPNQDIPPEGQAIPFSRSVRVIKRHRWKILSFIVAAVAVTWIISALLTPIYESTASIELAVSDREASVFLSTQLELAQSDSVLRRVFEQYRLWEREGEIRSAEQAANEAKIRTRLPNLRVAFSPGTSLLLISYRSPDRKLAADVANAVARSYQLHSLSEFLQMRLDAAKADLAARNRQLNADLNRAETERMAKEAAWRSVQNGTPEAAIMFSQSEVLKKFAEQLNDPPRKFADAETGSGKSTPGHTRPAVQLADMLLQFQNARESLSKRAEVEYHDAASRESSLQKLLAENSTEFDHLNAVSFEDEALIPAAIADANLNQKLVRKIKDTSIDAGFLNNRITVVDTARPGLKPVFPKLKLNLLLAFVFSTCIAVGAAVLSDVQDFDYPRHSEF